MFWAWRAAPCSSRRSRVEVTTPPPPTTAAPAAARGSRWQGRHGRNGWHGKDGSPDTGGAGGASGAGGSKSDAMAEATTDATTDTTPSTDAPDDTTTADAQGDAVTDATPTRRDAARMCPSDGQHQSARVSGVPPRSGYPRADLGRGERSASRRTGHVRHQRVRHGQPDPIRRHRSPRSCTRRPRTRALATVDINSCRGSRSTACPRARSTFARSSSTTRRGSRPQKGLTYGMFVGGLDLTNGLRPPPPIRAVTLVAGEGKVVSTPLRALRRFHSKVVFAFPDGGTLPRQRRRARSASVRSNKPCRVARRSSAPRSLPA